MKMPTLHDLFLARSRIQPLAQRTPLVPSPFLSRISGAASVHLKLECFQNTGAFKVRGAANKILSLTQEEQSRGVITFSTGNHGKATAYVAGRAGVRAVVCLSEHVPPYRARVIRDLGAEVVIKGGSQDEAEGHYLELVESRKLIPVVPFDDPLIIAGQGTIGLEILEELPRTDVLLVQLSGGGLLAGIALAAKAVNPGIQVVGLSLERSPAMFESVKAGKPVQVEEKDTLAESLLGGIGVENHFTLPLIQQYVDEHLLIPEEAIEEGLFRLFEEHRLVVEGAAAVGAAALLRNMVNVDGKKVVTLLTGASIDSAQYLRTLQSRLENCTS